jgi:heme-degrading monooxygenase HmoA
MIAVIFEVIPTADGKEEYLSIAAKLKEHLVDVPGFVSIERFQSLADERKILSLSFWESENAIEQWRNLEVHRAAQSRGRDSLFEEYRIRVASILRDYSMENRTQAPDDSKAAHMMFDKSG